MYDWIYNSVDDFGCWIFNKIMISLNNTWISELAGLSGAGYMWGYRYHSLVCFLRAALCGSRLSLFVWSFRHLCTFSFPSWFHFLFGVHTLVLVGVCVPYVVLFNRRVLILIRFLYHALIAGAIPIVLRRVSLRCVRVLTEQSSKIFAYNAFNRALLGAWTKR